MHLGKNYMMLSLELAITIQEKDSGVFTQFSTITGSVCGDNQEVNHQKGHC